MHIVGLDPGLSGAIAVLALDGTLEGLGDTPTLTVQVQRGQKQVHDCPGMVALLQPYAGQPAHVLIEEAQPMPGQGVTSTFQIGKGYGLWLGILAALQLPYTTIRPAIWKKAFSLGKDKEASRLRAMQLFPRADLRRKKDHGRAEALLLAYYGWRYVAARGRV